MQDLISINSQTQFGSIARIGGQIGEVVISEGVVVDVELVMNLQRTVTELFAGEYALLLNQKYKHAYTVEAQQYLSEMQGLQALAVLFKMRMNNVASEFLEVFHAHTISQMRVFHSRSMSIAWLKSKLPIENE